tara:strand:+ start:11518 stop:13860 length:2343 start_codon:yes stop_codon:yes gene_type:complete
MKNNIYKFFLVFVCCCYFNISSAEELDLNASEVRVDKTNKIVYAEGDVQIYDSKKNLIISEKAEYNKGKNLLKTIGESKITTSEKFKVFGSDIFYDKQKKIIYSDKDTIISDKDGNKIFVNMFNYLTEKNMFLSKGNIKIVDKRNNEYFFSEIYIDEKKRKIVGSDIKSFFKEEYLKADPRNEPRFFANSGTIDEDGVLLEKGIFTSCQNRGEGKCPPWTIRAKKIRHDSAKKTIYYDNAIVEVYDFPIFYFPKFFHPDPSVKRQSGFLFPYFKNNSNLSASATVPYFWAISKDKDMTFTPKIYTSENLLVMHEYRQAFKNGFWLIDSSYTKGYKNTTNTKLPGGRAHLFSKLFFDFSKENYFSNLEANFQHVSNDTYLKVHNIETDLVDKEENILTSDINYEFQDSENFFGMSASMFENKTIVDRSKYEYIIPNIVFERNVYSGEKLGLVDIYSNAFVKNYKVNQYTKMFINDFNWKSKQFSNASGIQSGFEGLLKVVNYEADNADKYKVDGFTSEAAGVVAYNAKLPLVKKNNTKDKINLLSPKFSLRAAPNQMRNISDDDLRLSYSNLFSLNKNSQVDVVERGVSAALGFEVSNNDLFENIPGKKNYSLSVGQIYNIDDNNNIPTRSSLDQKVSDLVGEAYLRLSDNLKLKSEFNLDNNLKDMNYQDFQANLILGNTNFNVKYLEEDNHIGSSSYVKSDIEIDFDNSTSLSFDLRRNLESNSTEFYNLAYDYINDCLRAGLVFRREFYSDRDIETSDSLMFRISFLPFGGVESPSID